MNANETRCPRCKQSIPKWTRYCKLCSGTTRFGLFCMIAKVVLVIGGIVVLYSLIAAA